jgi:hypothetical protein
MPENDELSSSTAPLPAELPESPLAFLDEATRMIEQVRTPDEALRIKDNAAALEAYARTVMKDAAFEIAAFRIRLRSTRKFGQLLIELGLKRGRPSAAEKNIPSGIFKLADHPSLLKLAAPAKQLAGYSPEQYEEVEKTAVERFSKRGVFPNLRALTGSDAAPPVPIDHHEWLTPPEIVAAAARSLGAIALDPCAETERRANVNAAVRFTKRDDGLRHPWHARTVFMNPPHSEFRRWIGKLTEEIDAAPKRDIPVEAAIAVLPMEPGAEWFSELHADAVCFVAESWRRACEPRPPYPLLIAYFGRAALEFARIFEWAGPVFAPVATAGGDKQ